MENADISLTQHLANKENRQLRTDKLSQILQLEMPIQRMECFDISHTGGEATVASCVVFDVEGPRTMDYRKFNITNITRKKRVKNRILFLLMVERGRSLRRKRFSKNYSLTNPC